MDKLFEQVMKVVPSEALPLILAVCVAFFGVYYYYGYRNFTDVLHSRAFMTLVVVAAAGLLLYSINKARSPIILDTEIRPVLLVPNFENDERDQYRNAFVQQIRASFSKVGLNPDSIVPIDSYITDAKAASLHMERYHSGSAVFSPKVVVTGDHTFLCISLLVPTNGGSKSYPLTETQIDSKVLDDIVATIIPTANATPGASVSPFLSRFQALEQQVAAMNATILALAAEQKGPKPNREYENRYAIVVGNSSNAEGTLPPFDSAISDAEGLRSALLQSGFRVTLLENPTVANVLEAFDQIKTSISEHDLLAFYYAGSSARTTDLAKGDPEQLLLPTHDFSLKSIHSSLTLERVIARMLALPNRDNLLLLDGCHGTAGLERAKLSEMVNSGDVLQIFAGSQDSGYAMENAESGGGVFTQILLKNFASMRESGSVSVSNIAATVTGNVIEATNAQQQPKLVTIGDGDIRF
ncbi:caspase family protein [Rhizobium leguminosarum]|nr:caspase family protein [Rhizobium leguminosarum]